MQTGFQVAKMDKDNHSVPKKYPRYKPLDIRRSYEGWYYEILDAFGTDVYPQIS